jgi:hypothetical protein
VLEPYRQTLTSGDRVTLYNGAIVELWSREGALNGKTYVRVIDRGRQGGRFRAGMHLWIELESRA